MSATFVFDVATTLGIGEPNAEPLPAPEEGFVTLRIPDGLSLQRLRDSAIGRRLLHDQQWYDRYAWSSEALPPGTYRLRVTVPNSNYRTSNEQLALLPEGESPAPVVLVAAALLCIQRQGGRDPLDEGWARCKENTTDGLRVQLTWDHGRLLVGGRWDSHRSNFVWAVSLRHCS